jgi:hypothetical protein
VLWITLGALTSSRVARQTRAPHNAANFREEPGAGKPPARICEGEAEPHGPYLHFRPWSCASTACAQNSSLCPSGRPAKAPSLRGRISKAISQNHSRDKRARCGSLKSSILQTAFGMPEGHCGGDEITVAAHGGRKGPAAQVGTAPPAMRCLNLWK